MILYNITVILEEEIEAAWLDWMRDVHTQKVMDTGLFASNRILKVLDSPNEGVTYCVQYIADTLEDYNKYEEKYSVLLQADCPSEFTNRFVFFSSVMKFISAT